MLTFSFLAWTQIPNQKSQLLVWTKCLPPHPHPFMCWYPNPCVVVFGDGVSKEFKVKWGHKGLCSDSISVLIRRDIRKSAFSLSLLSHPPPHTPVQERPCERTVRWWPCASHEECSHQRPNLLAPWLWTFSLQIFKEINVCCLSHLACQILLWQPRPPHLYFRISSFLAWDFSKSISELILYRLKFIFHLASKITVLKHLIIYQSSLKHMHSYQV